MKYVFILCYLLALPWDIHPEEDQEWWAGNMIKCIFNIYTVQQYAQPQIIQCSLYLAIVDNLAKIFALCTASLYNVSKLSWWLHKLGKTMIKIKLKLKYLPTPVCDMWQCWDCHPPEDRVSSCLYYCKYPITDAVKTFIFCLRSISQLANEMTLSAQKLFLVSTLVIT